MSLIRSYKLYNIGASIPEKYRYIIETFNDLQPIPINKFFIDDEKIIFFFDQDDIAFMELNQNKIYLKYVLKRYNPAKSAKSKLIKHIKKYVEFEDFKKFLQYFFKIKYNIENLRVSQYWQYDISNKCYYSERYKEYKNNL